jgi:uncharacterized damage-inducible protein DinB
MQFSYRSTVALVALSLAALAPAQAQGPTVVADVVKAMTDLEKKVVDLANAMPEPVFAYKAGAARTTTQVLQHIAADNYFLATPFGAMVPASTGIVTTDYKTVVAYENRKLTRTEVIADLSKSFAHVKQAMGGVTQAQLSETASMFGQTFTKQQVLLLTLTHVHEHLGQLIAYARANDIVPPWSR